MYSNIRLLVVDDSPLNHRITTLSLRGHFQSIETANNGQEALEMYKKQPFNVILMDVMMPVMDGYEATIAIRKYEKEQKLENNSLIIAMTASDAGDDINRCLESGMDTYLGKPFMADVFLKILEEKL